MAWDAVSMGVLAAINKAVLLVVVLGGATTTSVLASVPLQHVHTLAQVCTIDERQEVLQYARWLSDCTKLHGISVLPGQSRTSAGVAMMAWTIAISLMLLGAWVWAG